MLIFGQSDISSRPGISDYLIQLPGIDINMRDEHGRTVLMNMMVSKASYTTQQVEEIKILVEVHGADCNMRDNSGKNLLHHLASPAINNQNQSHVNTQWNIINDLVEYFIMKGASDGIRHMANTAMFAAHIGTNTR